MLTWGSGARVCYLFIFIVSTSTLHVDVDDFGKGDDWRNEENSSDCTCGLDMMTSHTAI